MKIIIQWFLACMVATSCSSQKNNHWDEVTIEYTAHSRGVYERVLVKNQHAWVTKGRDTKPVAIALTTAEIKMLKNAFEALNLETISSLESPTKKRFYDGAAIANLKITTQDKSYVSKSFDHGFPPTTIEKIVTLLVSFTKKQV